MLQGNRGMNLLCHFATLPPCLCDFSIKKGHLITGSLPFNLARPQSGAIIRQNLLMVPEVGIEPTLPKEHDFESCASAYSATPASVK